MAEVLQERLLPADIGRAFGIEAAARYLPAAGGSLGGDWYDVFSLAGGRVARGGRRRGRARRRGGGDHGPAADRRARLRRRRPSAGRRRRPGQQPDAEPRPAGHDDAGLARASTRRARRSRSSAPAIRRALVVDPSGTASYCWLQGGIPLGASATAIYTAETFPLPTGSIVLALHRRARRARGAVDRRRPRAAARAGRGRAATSRPCATAIVEQLVPEAPGDDVAFIAARVPPLRRPACDALGRQAGQPRADPLPAAPLAARARRDARRRPSTSSSPRRRRARTRSSTRTAPGRAEFAVDAPTRTAA